MTTRRQQSDSHSCINAQSTIDEIREILQNPRGRDYDTKQRAVAVWGAINKMFTTCKHRATVD